MKQFKAESKRVLDMMINSIYTNKEIFLRELVSNCSDAMDKLYYKGMSEGITGLNRGDMETAQRLVDEAAKAAGYNYHLYHGTNADFTKFDLRKQYELR